MHLMFLPSADVDSASIRLILKFRISLLVGGAPRSVMREFGLELSEDKGVRGGDTGADLGYLILQQSPAGTDDFNQDELA